MGWPPRRESASVQLFGEGRARYGAKNDEYHANDSTRDDAIIINLISGSVSRVLRAITTCCDHPASVRRLERLLQTSAQRAKQIVARHYAFPHSFPVVQLFGQTAHQTVKFSDFHAMLN